VSALNALGESALSNEASASPADLVPPVEPLPILDDFNRADENPLSDAGRWTNGMNGGEVGLYLVSNELGCTRTTTCTAWRNNAQYGPDAESWARIATLPGAGNHIRLYVRVQSPGSSAVDGYMLRTNQSSGTDQVFLERLDNGLITTRLTMNQELAVGDTLLLRAVGSTLEAWRHDGIAWARLGTLADSAYAAAGFVGVGLRQTTGRLDDFGGRTYGGPPPPPPDPPGPPTSLVAQGANAVVNLTWQPPTSDGGSPVTGYNVYRGIAPDGETLLQSLGPVTSYADPTVANGTTYYYKVSAVNAVDEGPLSNEASATPTDLFPPTEPLPTLDSFNRANENPLSDGGRWSNGVIGPGELGLRVISNVLACSKTSTCTAWRSNAQNGPDAESWARVAILPGAGNAIRLYVRVQAPGSSAVDGYMLRTNQRSAVDQVFLERIDNGVLSTRLAINQELALGDTLLLRAQGSTLEAWRYNGSVWTRIGVVGDSTYGAAGFVGVGLRGKKGRLDDFGGRALTG
jgi:hypothetical protein